MTVTVLTANMVNAACTAMPKEYSRKKSVKKTKETDKASKSPEPGQSTTCDKPGCRYGCICHLCTFTDQSPEADSKVVKCEKEYCRLGCICDSIEAQKEQDFLSHCGKPECMVECLCDNLRSDEKHKKKDDDDYRFTGQKKNAKFATLPRRESTYRLAKNLDAVSRKALLYYESSEMFVDQKKRRRKSKESPDATSQQYYKTIDLDEMDSGLSKPRKQEISGQKTSNNKPRPHQTPTMKTEMTDFSAIKSEISSQGSWNLSDLSDEYEDIDADSDEDLENMTCARTAVYKAIKRDKHMSGCTCSYGQKKSHECYAEDAKFNIPDDILSSGKWHTQWICLRSKGQSMVDADVGGLRLLEVISNCNYEDTKAKILSRLTSHISRDSYPKLKSFVVGDFKVSFLPKSDKPAMIPPEVKTKLPQNVYSIRIQIIKDPTNQVINLVDQDEVSLADVQPKQLNVKSPGSSGVQSTSITIQKSAPQTHLTTTSSIVPGGISGLSRLQITRPTGPIGFMPLVPNSSSSGTVMATGTVPFATTAAAPRLVFIPDQNLVEPVGSRSEAITLSQPIGVLGSTATMVTTSVTSKVQSFPGYVVKGQTVPLAVTVPFTGSIQAQSKIGIASNNQGELQNYKRKLNEHTLTFDLKRSKLENGIPQVQGVSMVTTGSMLHPIPSVNENVGQVSVLRCVKCNVILTAEDITSWVLSQDSIQEKICVKCRGNQRPKINILPQRTVPPSPNKAPLIILDTENQSNTSDINDELVRTIEKESDKIRNIVKEVDSDALQRDGKDSDKSVVPKTSTNENTSSAIIDLSSDDESKPEKSKPTDIQKDTYPKSGESGSVIPSENEDDELEAAIRDAQDDYDDMARNLSDENESPSDDPRKESPTKSNVIVIDDEEEDTAFLMKRKGDLVSTDGSNVKRLKVLRALEEDEDVDVTSFSENDSINLSSFSDSPLSAWHSSSCSLNHNLQRKKRKAQLELIENRSINQVEVRESMIKMDAEEYRKYKIDRERNRRTELQQLYHSLSCLVLPEEEDINVSVFAKATPKIRTLNKALEVIRTEVPRTGELISKVKAFKEYQQKLQKRLQELKAFHIQRGISKEKLENQLDKIAVVCDKIYDHLPEIKQHIKSKKGVPETIPVSASSQGIKSKKHAKVKRSKPATPKQSKAEIYIDNPEEYDNEGQIPESATPLSALPGSYIPGGVVQRPVICAPAARPHLSTPVVKVAVSVSNIRPPGNTINRNLPGISPLVVNTGQGVKPITAQSGNTALSGGIPIRYVANPALQVCQINAQTSNSSVLPNQSPTILPHNLVPLQSHTSTSEALIIAKTPELQKILSAPSSVQSLGHHSSTSAFSDVLGEMIRNNVEGSSQLDENEEVLPEKNLTDGKTAPPQAPQYDVNLLKDEILDDTTGELIAVVMNEEGNENSNDSSKTSEQFNISSQNKDVKTNNISKDNEISNTAHGNDENKEDLSNNQASNGQENCEKQQKDKKLDDEEEETNIESLLDDIKSLSQEPSKDESPSKSNQSYFDKLNKPDENKLPITTIVEPDDSVLNDQVDGDLFNFSSNKDTGNLSESDSNNSAQTNVYMEDSDGNISIAGDLNDELDDLGTSSPKIVSVMSISDVLGDSYKNINKSSGMAFDDDAAMSTCSLEDRSVSENS